jgi:ABC-type glycerol-3-phosphate transport system substrate-binding protein
MKGMVSLLAGLVGIIATTSYAADKFGASDIPVDPSLVKGTITYFTHWANFVEDGHMKKWGDDFKKIYPNVQDVKIVLLKDYRNEMTVKMAEGDYGDVVEMMDNLPQDDYDVYYEPLNSLGMQKNYMFSDRFAVDGEYYAFTYGVNAEALVYKKTLFKKAGIEKFPLTKSDLFADCKKLKAIGVTPFMLNMAAGWPMQQWDKEVLIFAGDPNYYGKMLKDTGAFAKDKPYGRVLTFIRELIEAGCAEETLTSTAQTDASTAWNVSLEAMSSGKIGMWFLANWSIPQILGNAEKNHRAMTSADLGMAPLPIDDSGEAKILMDPDFGVAVSSQSTNKPTAKAFLYYLLNMTDLANAAGFIPGNVNVPASLPQIAELRALNPKIINLVTPAAEFRDAMAAARFDFMTGTYLRPPVLAKDFDGALQDLNKRWTAAIGEN